mgnify:CR=1 FL=1
MVDFYSRLSNLSTLWIFYAFSGGLNSYENKIKEKYPNCSMKNILDYENTGISNLIEYDIIKNQNNQVSKITFTFSSFLLQGNLNENGENVIFPVFIELLLDEGFIISRAKAKSTLFEFDDDNQFLISDDKIVVI